MKIVKIYPVKYAMVKFLASEKSWMMTYDINDNKRVITPRERRLVVNGLFKIFPSILLNKVCLVNSNVSKIIVTSIPKTEAVAPIIMLKYSEAFIDDIFNKSGTIGR